MVDVLTPEQRRKNMSRIRGKNTRPEVELRSMLHKAGFRFRLHYKKLPGKPDIVLPRFRTAVFVHGCFWHRHQGCRFASNPKTRPDFWKKKFQETVERDARNAQLISASGWQVVTIWECELKKNPEEALHRLHLRLKGDADA